MRSGPSARDSGSWNHSFGVPMYTVNASERIGSGRSSRCPSESTKTRSAARMADLSMRSSAASSGLKVVPRSIAVSLKKR